MTLRRRALWTLLLAKAVAGMGVGWDIRWHIVIGRDSFWIPPHVMTYAGVTVAAVVSLGVLVVETRQAQRGQGPREAFRLAGLVGSRGWHLAWWGLALTILAAPIDDLWHRLFGIDVTLWSPPHLLGLLGAQINSLACLLIAREAWPAGSRARVAAFAIAGALLFAGFQTGVDPSVRTAFLYGGVRFFTYAILGAALFTFSLLLSARLGGSRELPVFVAAAAVLLQLATTAVGDVGMAVLQPEPMATDVIAADPTSPIAIAHELARRNGVPPGRGITLRLFPVLAAALMVLVDPCRRPGRAGLAFGLGLYVVTAAMLSRSPALAHARPELVEAAIAAVLTALAAVCSTAAAKTFEARVTGRAAEPGLPSPDAIPLTPGA